MLIFEKPQEQSMRFLSIAMIAALSLVGIAASTSAQQVNRPTLADVLGPTLGSGGTLRLTFPDKSGNYVQDHLTVLIPKQEPQVITDGTATLKYGMIEFKSSIFPTDAISPIGDGRYAIWFRTESSIQIGDVRLQQFVIYQNGNGHVIDATTTGGLVAYVAARYMKNF